MAHLAPVFGGQPTIGKVAGVAPVPGPASLPPTPGTRATIPGTPGPAPGATGPGGGPAAPPAAGPSPGPTSPGPGMGGPVSPTTPGGDQTPTPPMTPPMADPQPMLPANPRMTPQRPEDSNQAFRKAIMLRLLEQRHHQGMPMSSGTDMTAQGMAMGTKVGAGPARPRTWGALSSVVEC
jgi:hypothetical protein